MELHFFLQVTVFDDLFQFRITFGETSNFQETGRINFPLVFLAEFFCSPNTFKVTVCVHYLIFAWLLFKTIIYGLQLAKSYKHTSVSSEMESEHLNQSDDRTTQNNQHEETSEERKESSNSSSRRKSSPSSRQRNYRKRSVSESPEKSPQRRSPENSPSARKRSRNLDFRGNDISHLIHIESWHQKTVWLGQQKCLNKSSCLW